MGRGRRRGGEVSDGRGRGARRKEREGEEGVGRVRWVEERIGRGMGVGMVDGGVNERRRVVLERRVESAGKGTGWVLEERKGR
jgi:hypothetical protein